MMTLIVSTKAQTCDPPKSCQLCLVSACECPACPAEPFEYNGETKKPGTKFWKWPGCMEGCDCKEETQNTACPVGRYGTSEEVASLITFLCSNAASYISGTSIEVDGGQSGHI